MITMIAVDYNNISSVKRGVTKHKLFLIIIITKRDIHAKPNNFSTMPQAFQTYFPFNPVPCRNHVPMYRYRYPLQGCTVGSGKQKIILFLCENPATDIKRIRYFAVYKHAHMNQLANGAYTMYSNCHNCSCSRYLYNLDDYARAHEPLFFIPLPTGNFTKYRHTPIIMYTHFTPRDGVLFMFSYTPIFLLLFCDFVFLLTHRIFQSSSCDCIFH